MPRKIAPSTNVTPMAIWKTRRFFAAEPRPAIPQAKLDVRRHPVSIATVRRSKSSRPVGPPAVRPESTA